MCRTIKKALQVGCGLCVVLVVAAVLSLGYYVHHAPYAWKEKAIAQVSQLYGDQAWQATQRAEISPPTDAKPDADVEWTTDHFMLMKNGEWLVYTHSNGHDSPVVGDHFIAHASNGKWYYSSFHFCRDLIALWMSYPDQPGSLAEFVYKCSLAEFDGQSDVCLQRTGWELGRVWPVTASPSTTVPFISSANLPPPSAIPGSSAP